MNSTLFTIGFTKKTAEEFFRLLDQAKVERVIDVRENRVGQLAGFAKYPDIAFLLDRILGIEYLYEPLLAPSPEIRDAYRSTKNWEAYEKSFLELIEQRGILERMEPSKFDGRIAFLCSEAGPEKCHRRLVAEILAKHWKVMGHQVEVAHLVIEKEKPQRKLQVKSRVGADPI
jgi:uncharacterized protein (DUF488 family)